MTQREKIKFRITDVKPNPKEVDWWIDLSTDEYGGCMRYYREDTQSWELFNLNDQHLNQLVDYLNKEMEELGSSTLETIESTKAELQEQIEQLQQTIAELQPLQASTISNNLQIDELRQLVNQQAETISNLTKQLEDLSDHSITYSPSTEQEPVAEAEQPQTVNTLDNQEQIES